MEQERYKDVFFEAKQYIKQYGMKRSGTCYTKAFIEQNFKDVCVISNILGWKHGPYRPETKLKGSSWMGDHHKPNTHLISEKTQPIIEQIIDDYYAGKLRYVVTVRNPYYWIPAMISYHDHLRATPRTIYRLAKSWNNANGSWLRDLPGPLTAFISYDGLLDVPEMAKDIIGRRLGLEPFPGLDIPKRVVSPGAKYGLPFLPRKNAFMIYNQRILNRLNDILDPELMSYFQYTFIRKVPACDKK